MENQEAIQNESFVDKVKSIHWIIQIIIFGGLLSLIFSGEFKNLAGAMLILSLYSAYSLFRPSLKNRRLFYILLSVISFVSVFVLIAIGQLLD